MAGEKRGAWQRNLLNAPVMLLQSQISSVFGGVAWLVDQFQWIGSLSD
jgi:hypothetical protein